MSARNHIPGFRWPDDRISQADDNLLYNPDFHLVQRGQTFTAASDTPNDDGNYTADRWVLLSDGNDIVDLTRDGAITPDGSRASWEATVQTANAKWGYLQILENHDAWPLRNQRVSLQFKARTDTGAVIRNIRAAVLSWDGTSNSPTKDVVSAWNIEGTDPTLVANWTYESTPADISVAVDAFGLHKIEDILVDTSGMNNLAVFIWVDDTDAAVSDILYIAEVKLNRGRRATRFTYRTWAAELNLCEHYYWKTYELGTEPGTITGVGALRTMSHGTATFTAIISVIYPTKMFAVPTITVYNPNTGNTGSYNRGGTAIAAGSTNAGSAGTAIVNTAVTTANATHECHLTVEAEIGV